MTTLIDLDYEATQTALAELVGVTQPTISNLMTDGKIPATGTLGELLRQSPNGAVLTCSALKKAYRDRLRAAAPGLGFIYLEIRPDEALRRVTARAGDHFFPVKLVDSQFATLESPVSEAGVLALDGMLSLAELTEQALVWINKGEGDE
mgnify:CR=1 FL=1